MLARHPELNLQAHVEIVAHFLKLKTKLADRYSV
jgi:hypothetical protein